jgi:hypothetical protein
MNWRVVLLNGEVISGVSESSYINLVPRPDGVIVKREVVMGQETVVCEIDAPDRHEAAKNALLCYHIYKLSELFS